jgi:hypothetical protein
MLDVTPPDSVAEPVARFFTAPQYAQWPRPISLAAAFVLVASAFSVVIFVRSFRGGTASGHESLQGWPEGERIPQLTFRNAMGRKLPIW